MGEDSRSWGRESPWRLETKILSSILAKFPRNFAQNLEKIAKTSVIPKNIVCFAFVSINFGAFLLYFLLLKITVRNKKIFSVCFFFLLLAFYMHGRRIVCSSLAKLQRNFLQSC
jgi:hypothetical protein